MSIHISLHPGPLDYAAGITVAVLLLGSVATLVWRATAQRSRRRQYERAAMQALERELDDLLGVLRPALTLPDAMDLSGAELSRPPAAAAAIGILDERLPSENLPVKQSFDRYRALPRRTAVLAALVELRLADAGFSDTARRLDRRVTGLIGDHNAPRQIDPLHDRLETAYFFGRIHGMPQADLLERIGVPAALVDAVQARAAAIAADADVETLASQFLAARQRLAAAASQIGLMVEEHESRRR